MFTLEIETDNAAFDGNAKLEIANILNSVCARLVFLEQNNVKTTEGKIRDRNGNTVGKWRLDS